MKASSLSRVRRSGTQSLPHVSFTSVRREMQRTKVQVPVLEEDAGGLFRSPLKLMNQQAPQEKGET